MVVIAFLGLHTYTSLIGSLYAQSTIQLRSILWLVWLVSAYYLFTSRSPPLANIGCPSERAMVLAHIRSQGFLQVVRETGLRGLFLGFSSTIYRDVSFNTVFFTARELFVRGYRSRYDESPDAWRRVLLGIPAGCIASVFACPFDVVKTRMQGKELGELQLWCLLVLVSL